MYWGVAGTEQSGCACIASVVVGMYTIRDLPILHTVHTVLVVPSELTIYCIVCQLLVHSIYMRSLTVFLHDLYDVIDFLFLGQITKLASLL